MSVIKVADGRLNVTVAAGAGPLSSVQFPGSTPNIQGAPNYLILVDGETRALPFTLVPASPGDAVATFQVVRTGGSFVTVPLVVTDACGPWPTFVGGGGPFLDPPPTPGIAWAPTSVTVNAVPGTVSVEVVQLTTTSARISSADIQISPEIGSLVSVNTANLGSVRVGETATLGIVVAPPLNAALGTMRGTVTVRDGGSPLGQTLPIAVTVFQPTAATVPEGLSRPTADRVAASADGPPFIKDQVLVGFQFGTPPARIDAITASVGAVLLAKDSDLNWYQLRLGASSPPLDQAVDLLAAIADVRMASRVHFGRPLAIPSTVTPRTPVDAGFDSWNPATPADNNWGQELVQLPSAWGITTGSAAVKVGVIEDGFHLGHEDLRANVDPASTTCSACTSDLWAHGTHVAGIIGARGNNGIGYAGVAWDVTLLLLARDRGPRIDAAFGLLGTAHDAYAAAAKDAAKAGSSIINISQGELYADTRTAQLRARPYRDMIETVRDVMKKDVLFVVAAGNDAQNVDRASPAVLTHEFSNVITVGGVKRCDYAQVSGESCATPVRYVHSNYGLGARIAAPATDSSGLWATCAIRLDCPSAYIDPVHGTEDNDGTSYAAPYVSGAAALLLARAQALNTTGAVPPPTAEKLREHLVQGAIAGNKFVCRDAQPFVITAASCSAATGIPVLNVFESLKALERSKRWGVGSVGPGGTPAAPGPAVPPVNYVTGAGSPALSADGRFLAFETHSLNLVAGTFGRDDIGSSVMVKDRQTGALEWVSDPAHGGRPSVPSVAASQASATVRPNAASKVYAVSPSMSDDGRYVAFVEYTGTSASNKTTNIVVYDRTARTYQVFDEGRLGLGGGQLDATTASNPSLVISGDGSTIVYRVAPDSASGLFFGDLVSRNRVTGQRTSIASSLVYMERGGSTGSGPGPFCTTPPPNRCSVEVPLQQAAPEFMGRGVSFNGRRVVVRACCSHVYRIDDGVATKLDPDAPTPDPAVDPIYPEVGVGLIDMSSDGRFVVFSQRLSQTPNPFALRDRTRDTTTMYRADVATGELRTLTTTNDAANVSWSGPFALSGDGGLVFYQVRATSGAPVVDHPTLRQLMVVRDTFTGTLVQDENTGKTEVVTANVEGTALRCGIEDTGARLVANHSGRVLAYVDRDYDATYDVVPWDRNQLSDVYVIDRRIPIDGSVHVSSSCTNLDIGPIIPLPH